MTIEIHNPELEIILQQRLKAGKFANVEEMLMQTFRAAQGPADEDCQVKPLEAAAPALPVWQLGAVDAFHRREIYDDLS